MTASLYSIGRLLAIIISVTLVPTAILALALVWYGYESNVSRVERSTAASIQTLAKNVDDRLVQVKVGLDALSASPALAQRDWAGFHAQSLAFLSKNPIAASIFLIDPIDGSQLMNTLRPPGTPLPAIAGRGARELDAFNRGADWVVSDYYAGQVTGQSMVAVAVPLHDPHDVSGVPRLVLGAGVDAASLVDVISDAHLPATWTVSVLDRNGIFLARQPRNDAFIGQPTYPQFLSAMARAPEGSLRATAKDGKKVRAIYSTAAKSRFVVSVGIPEKELIGTVRRTGAIVAAILALVLGLAVWVATRISRRIRGSLRALAASARVSQGHVAGAKKMQFKEAAQVRLGLNMIASELEQTQADLEAMSAELANRKASDLSGVIEAAAHPMLIANDLLVIEAANQQCHQLFGFPQAGLIGHSLKELVDTKGNGHHDTLKDATGKTSDGRTIALRVRTSVFGVGSTRFMAVTFEDGLPA